MKMKKWQIVAAAGLTLALSLGCFGCSSSDSQSSDTEEATSGEATEEVGTYVDVDWLNENIDDVFVVDARDTSSYTASHIPGAVSASWKSLSNVAVAEGEDGWGALNDSTSLVSTLALEGLTNDRPIVVYCDVAAGWGEDGRTMWTLQNAGYEDIHILNGGWRAWVGAGYDTEGVTTGYANNTSSINAVTTKDVKAAVKDGSAILVDARAAEEYSGETNMGEAEMGHIPGAVNVPNTSLFNSDGTLKTADELAEIFEAAGLTDKDAAIITYCTGGVRAANVAEVLVSQGYTNVSVYTCSFAEWAGQGNKVEK